MANLAPEVCGEIAARFFSSQLPYRCTEAPVHDGLATDRDVYIHNDSGGGLIYLSCTAIVQAVHRRTH